jgi:hypothetical protein
MLTMMPPATAATPDFAADPLQNTNVDIAYNPPKNPNYESDYELLKKRQILEELREFLAPLRLPRHIQVRTTQCGQTNSWYDSTDGSVTICYEWVDFVRRIAPVDTSPDGITRDDVIVGAIVQVVLHEMSHAVFDQLNVPHFGREEDGADLLAGFVMLQFGSDVAKRTLSGAAYFFQFEASSREPTATDFSDVHGTDAERFYNYLCIAYGGQPDAFRDLATKFLPPSRIGDCAREYHIIQSAFLRTIYPHIDKDLLKIVQSRQWLLPGD